MDIYANKEVVSEFNVSNTTVLNWIIGAQEKKNNLQVKLVGKKYKILRSEHNRAELFRLSGQAVNYRNKIEELNVTPDNGFYKVFSERQIIEIINDIRNYNTIPLKFTYLGKGAESWVDFVKKSAEKGTYKAFLTTPELLNIAFNLLEKRIGVGKMVNIIDCGTGDSLSIKETTQRFNNLGKLKTFVGVDISEEILNISKKNITSVIDPNKYKVHVHDFEYSDMSDYLFRIKDKGSINLIYYIGNTIGNQENIRRGIENFKYSMDADDYLVITNKLERDTSKTVFEHDIKNPRYLWIPKALGIDIDSCTFENYYDEVKQRRTSDLILGHDYNIEFQVEDKSEVISLNKGDRITLWHHKMSTQKLLFELIESSGMKILDMSLSTDETHIVVICKPDSI